jgi:hypothetical protein
MSTFTVAATVPTSTKKARAIITASQELVAARKVYSAMVTAAEHGVNVCLSDIVDAEARVIVAVKAYKIVVKVNNMVSKKAGSK